MTTLNFTVLALATVLLSACGSEGVSSSSETDLGPACAAGDVGDLSLPAELELYNQRADGVSTPIQCGGSIALATPPQGGRVSFIGMRITNMSACGVTVASRVSNVDGDEAREDTRTLDLDGLADGWAGSVDDRILSFSHLALCPNDWSSADVQGTEYELQVTVTDKAGRQAASTMLIVPECPEGDAKCSCFCGADFEPGVTLCGN